MIFRSEDQTGLGTGTYNVTVYDTNLCSATAEFTLTEPTAVQVSGTTVEPPCNSGSGALNGEINITASEGTPGYTYAWTGPGVDATAEDQIGLGAGTYNVTVYDSNLCSATAEFTLNEPTAVEVTGTTVEPPCNSGSGRSEERRVGKESRIGCRYRLSPYH